MKLLHIADLHLGKTVNEMNLIEDQSILLEQVIDTMVEEQVDGLLIAGDIYDRSIPPKEAVMLFDAFLTKVSKLGVHVFAVAGNHDSPERISFGSEILAKEHVYLEGILNQEIKVISFSDIEIHLLPFFKPAHVKAIYPEEEMETFEDAMRVVLSHHKVKKDKKNILVTHQFVTGTKEVEESDSEQLLSVGGTDHISYALFDDYDYVALGHIHGPQRVGRDTIRYSGSLMKYSFSEEFHHKSMTVVDVGEEISLKTIEFKPRYDMRRIKGKLSDLVKPEIVNCENPKDYLGVTLTNQEELVDPIGTLRMYYPNIMELQLEKNQVKREGELSVSKVKEKTSMELFDSFLELTTGEVEEQRHHYMSALLEEGGML